MTIGGWKPPVGDLDFSFVGEVASKKYIVPHSVFE